MVEPTVVANLEKPGGESGFAFETIKAHPCLQHGVLRDIVGGETVATAQGQQEPPQGFLLGLKVSDEFFLGHGR